MVQKELSYPAADTDLALERALFPQPFRRIPAPASKASFHWVKRPRDDMEQAVFYSDGSLLDGPSKLLGRCGWAFVAVSQPARIRFGGGIRSHTAVDQLHTRGGSMGGATGIQGGNARVNIPY